jgi:hypothetical protein
LRVKRFNTIPYFSIDIPEAFRLQGLASSSGNAKGGKNRFLTFICSCCTGVDPSGLIMLQAFYFETYP